LGHVLRDKGDLAAGLVELRKGHELGSKQAGWRYPSSRWVKDAERMVELDALLAKALKDPGLVQDAAGLMELARFATHQKKLFAATAALYRSCFEAHPDWAADDVPPQPNGLLLTNRRYAAAVAAMASAGNGDGAGLTEEKRNVLLLRALGWMRAELATWENRLDGATPDAAAEVARMLTGAVEDGWLAPARDAARFAKLPASQRDEFRQVWAGSARLYAAAFALDAKLADDVAKWHRYDAACQAALAGTGQGSDADKLDAAERARLRKQAAEWPRADLAHWAKLAASAKPADRNLVRQRMKHWQEDTDLAGVRDAKGLEKLAAEEREAWQKLWDDVADVLRKAETGAESSGPGARGRSRAGPEPGVVGR
jgi:hypothetical protein